MHHRHLPTSPLVHALRALPRLADMVAAVFAVAMLACLPVAGAVHSAREAPASAPSVGADCPAGCPNPAHHHTPHDHATCALCQISSRDLACVVLTAQPLQATLVDVTRAPGAQAPAEQPHHVPQPRGPPGPVAPLT